MKAKVYYRLFLIISGILISFLFLSCSSQNRIILPGNYDEFIQLPNGWRLTPVGEHLQLHDFPMNSIIIEKNFLVVSHSGYKTHSLSLIDINQKKEIQKIVIPQTWRGLAYDQSSKKLYVSGGNLNLIYEFKFMNDQLILSDSIFLTNKNSKQILSITGIAFSSNKKLLCAGTKNDSSVYFINPSTREVIKKIFTGEKVYDLIIDERDNSLFSSLWSGKSLLKIDLNTFEILSRIEVDDHPTEMLIDTIQNRLFVANANKNTVSVIDISKLKEIERLNVALKPDIPPGSTPNSLAFDETDNLLFVANADNNYVTIFNVKDYRSSEVEGFIPVGWYPTSIKFHKPTDQILVVNGKGLGSLPNPEGPDPTRKNSGSYEQYIAQLIKGTLSFIKLPDEQTLRNLSQKVYKNTPYIMKENIKGDHMVFDFNHSGKRSNKIKYVFYVIKENRTYDQIFGDLEQGNSDSTLCIFPRLITPNHHKLAEEFVLFDNFYVDAEVSADGHNWSTAAYATDYVEKTWPVLYGGRGGTYDYEGGVPAARPSSGYIWNNVLNAGLTVRNYGEFVQRDKNGKYVARDEDLKSHTCENFPGYDLSISDLTRFEEWKKDFYYLLEKDSIPNFNKIRLPNDHTAGTRTGYLTPQAYVAQNDYALGLMVQEISKSKIWNESVIFVLEDDAQNGSDHVDAHRSILLVISPYIKRNFVDHTMYSTSSVLKTIELILGLPPMTQFDLSANPIHLPFTDKPNLQPYEVIEPLIDINEKNRSDAYGSKRCEEFDLTKEDAIPDIEFNEIIWKAIRGENSEMPAPVRSAFVRIIDED